MALKEHVGLNQEVQIWTMISYTFSEQSSTLEVLILMIYRFYCEEGRYAAAPDQLNQANLKKRSK